MPLPQLTIENLIKEALLFAKVESISSEPDLYGNDNGKKVGTYLEMKLNAHLVKNYSFVMGNAADGIDFPGIGVDLKVTSHRQPQSSCPFRSARQKIFGLGYSLLVFVYTKTDDVVARTSNLRMDHVVFIKKEQTADYSITKTIQEILRIGGNADDIVALIQDRNLPIDEIEAREIADEILANRTIEAGYLTISNANQWRLQYGHAITHAGAVSGIVKIL